MSYTPRRVLITGGAGFIGANFVRHLLRTDAAIQIVNLDALTYAGSLDNLRGLEGAERHRFVHGDICDAALIARLLREHDIDTIVHFAAESHVDRSISSPAEFLRTNIQGTASLLEEARRFWIGEQGLDAQALRKGRRFHHISTDEVYGELGAQDAAFIEGSPCQPSSPYSASKAAADHLVQAWFRTYGLPVLVTRSSNNYGPGQNPEKLIPLTIRHCLEQKPIPVYGDGSNIRDWLHVQDHCRGIERVLREAPPGGIWNIGADNEHSNLAIVRLICALMDERRPEQAPHARLIHFVSDRPGHDWRYALDARKLRTELGWAPAESFESGMRKTVDEYLRCRPGG